MTREAARNYINDLIGAELPRAKKRVSGYDTFVCPFCGNGSGADGTGISTKDGKHWTCFKGCFVSWDYLDILKRVHGAASESDIFERYSLTVDGRSGANSTSRPSATSQPTAAVHEPTDAPPVDYMTFFQQASATLQASPEALSYIQGRGISPETAARFMLGYSPDWKSPAAVRAGRNPPTSRRLIIPTSRTGYTARAIEAGTPDAFRFMKEGEAGYFNLKVLQGAEPVYIVEGAFDALSICEVGAEACALGSTSGVDKFLAQLDRDHPAARLILSLDTDKAGQDAQVKLKKGLEAREIGFYEVNAAGGYKDPNEHLTVDREAFTAIVHSDPAAAARQEAEAEKEAYIATAAAYHINAFHGAVEASANTPAIKTGFQRLDDALDGGLYEGLYIFGAISSLGKTTYVLQLADQIARRGHDVLFFSLEMSRYELMAKSISRLTLENSKENSRYAKTTRGILAGERWKNYGDDERLLIWQSINDYADFGRRIYIHEGVGDIGAEQIRQEVQRHIIFTGNAPVVVIDYLQIIAPHDIRATDKQIVDRAVLELKRLSRDKKITVIAVSSFNRDNYTAPVNMAAFKESGAVEYSSDVLLGLQLAGMDAMSQSDAKRAETISRIEKMKAADPRKAQLKILKNRNGRIGESLFYDYYPKFNAFRETDAPDAEPDGDNWADLQSAVAFYDSR